MAFAASMQWDVRTTGSNSNGGGFDPTSGVPGTNYAQQDSPQVTYTDLVIDGTTNTKCTSAGTPFTSAHVGNVINVTSGTGFTVQRVQILSVTAAVATCDKSLGTLSSTGGNGKLGGGLLTVAQANTLIVQGNTVNIKAGTYTHTTTTTITVGSRWIGYNSTWGDELTLKLSARTQPLITTATNSIELFNLDGTTQSYELNNLHLTNTAGTRASGIVAVNGHMTNFPPKFVGLLMDGFTVAINGDNAGAHYDWTYIYVANCELKNSTGTSSNGQISMNSGTVYIFDSFIHDGAGYGIFSAGTMHAVRTIFARNTQAGWGVGGSNGTGSTLVGCNFVGNGNSGIIIGSSSTEYVVLLLTRDCIYYGNTGYGITSAGSQYYVQSQADTGATNAFGANTTAARNGYFACPGDITLTADPFTNSAGNDFSLNSTAGGGAALKGAAFQQQ